MKVYLAARYSRRQEMLVVTGDLLWLTHTVTSRWIGGNHELDEAGLSCEAVEAARQRFALEDYFDIRAADCTISFTEPPRSTPSRGGRHVEFGIALHSAQRLIVVGPRENVFHCLSRVEAFESWADCYAALEREGPSKGERMRRLLR